MKNVFSLIGIFIFFFQEIGMTEQNPMVTISFTQEILKKQLLEIEAEIEKVNQEIHTLRLKIMHDEVKSEDFIKYEWKEYTEQIEKAETSEKRLENLNQKKNDLLKQKQDILALIQAKENP